jgi:hypothetical protein
LKWPLIEALFAYEARYLREASEQYRHDQLIYVLGGRSSRPKPPPGFKEQE